MSSLPRNPHPDHGYSPPVSREKSKAGSVRVITTLAPPVSMYAGIGFTRMRGMYGIYPLYPLWVETSLWTKAAKESTTSSGGSSVLDSSPGLYFPVFTNRKDGDQSTGAWKGFNDGVSKPNTLHRPSSTAPPPKSASTSSPTTAIFPATPVSSGNSRLDITSSKNVRVGLPTTIAWTSAADSSAETKGPGPRESWLKELEIYFALCVAIKGGDPSPVYGASRLRMRKAVVRVS